MHIEKIVILYYFIFRNITFGISHTCSTGQTDATIALKEFNGDTDHYNDASEPYAPIIHDC